MGNLRHLVSTNPRKFRSEIRRCSQALYESAGPTWRDNDAIKFTILRFEGRARMHKWRTLPEVFELYRQRVQKVVFNLQYDMREEQRAARMRKFRDTHQ